MNYYIGLERKRGKLLIGKESISLKYISLLCTKIPVVLVGVKHINPLCINRGVETVIYKMNELNHYE